MTGSRRWSVVALVLLPVVVQAAVVARFGEDMLVWDEFFFVDVFRDIADGKSWLPWIWRQHNEHRIVWTKLLVLAHAPWSNWNPIVEMYVSALLTGVIAWGVWKIYVAAGGVRAIYFLPVSLMLCSVAQYMNMLYGLMTSHYFTVAAIVWAVVLLQRDTFGSLFGALALAFAGLVSSLTGAAVLPAGAVMLALRRQGIGRIAVWIAGSVAMLLAYFWHYQTPAHHRAIDWSDGNDIVRVVSVFITNIGVPLSTPSLRWSMWVGALTLLAMAATWRAALRSDRRAASAGLVALGIVGLGCAAAVALGRSIASPYSALESKYVTYTTLCPLSAYLLIAALPARRGRAFALAVVVPGVLAGLVAANLFGLKYAAVWQAERRDQRYHLQTIELQAEETVGLIYFPDAARQAAAYLRATRRGPFRHLVDALTMPLAHERAVTAPVIPSMPLNQEFACPVDTLRDLQLVLGRSPAPTLVTGALRIRLKEGEALLGSAIVVSSSLSDFQHVPVEISTPVENCRGRRLVLEVSMNDPAATDGPHAWTYPPYYSGVLRQGPAIIEGRNLGLTFNWTAAGLTR